MLLFQVDAKKHTLAKYLMEITLVDYELSLLLPSQIAAAASYLSTHLIDKQSAEWVSSFFCFFGNSFYLYQPITISSIFQMEIVQLKLFSIGSDVHQIYKISINLSIS